MERTELMLLPVSAKITLIQSGPGIQAPSPLPPNLNVEDDAGFVRAAKKTLTFAGSGFFAHAPTLKWGVRGVAPPAQGSSR